MSTPLRAYNDARPPIAHLLKSWRTTRKISQLDLSLTAGISQRQLSFIESGRARPSRDTVLHLAEALEVPLRERNTLLQAAGFSALYPIRNLMTPYWPRYAMRSTCSLSGTSLIRRYWWIDRPTSSPPTGRLATYLVSTATLSRFCADVAGTARRICCASAFTPMAFGRTFSIGRKWRPSC